MKKNNVCGTNFFYTGKIIVAGYDKFKSHGNIKANTFLLKHDYQRACKTQWCSSSQTENQHQHCLILLTEYRTILLLSIDSFIGRILLQYRSIVSNNIAYLNTLFNQIMAGLWSYNEKTRFKYTQCYFENNTKW